MAYTRRGVKGGCVQAQLSGDLSAGATTVPVGSGQLATWAGITTNGPAAATINLGKADEETITFTGISGDNLTGVTRGQNGTTGQSHTSGATVDHTSTAQDFDEANAHIADTTLDHHTQYVRTDGSRAITGVLRVLGSDSYFGAYANTTGTGVSRVRLSASAGGVAAYAEGDGATRDFNILSKGAAGNVNLQNDSAVTLVRASSAALASGDTALLVLFNNGSASSLVRCTAGAADSGGTGRKVLTVPN